MVLLVNSVENLGAGLGGGHPLPVFWVKKEEITEGKKAKRATTKKTLFLKVWVRH